MAIDKSSHQMPQGQGFSRAIRQMLGSDTGESYVVENEDGSVDVQFGPSAPAGPGDVPFGANLADHLEDSTLHTLATDIMDNFNSDLMSRKEWADTFVKGLEVLGLKYEERTEPWVDACGAFSTLLAEAAIRFQAEAMAETFPAAGPVKTKILGELTPEKEDAAERVRVDMNYELTEVMTEYRPEHERLLYALGLSGSSFKKVYYDPNMGRQTSLYIPAEDVVVPYGASNIDSAERVTHVMRKTKNEVLKLQASGFYRNVDLGEPERFHSDIEEKKAEEGGYSLSEDNRYTILEVHEDLVIEGLNEGVKLDDNREIARPYVVSVEQGTGTVLAIRRNWDAEDKLYRKRQHFVHYVYVPGFGFYGLGLIHIVGGYAKAGTSLIRQLVDAGTLSNLQAGFKTRGLRVEGDDSPIGPGEWKDVNVPGGALRDNIMPLPFGEPSATLLSLLDKLTEEGRRLGAISDVNVSDMSATAPVGTTLALLERTLKPMTAVQARVHHSMKQEFQLLHKIIKRYAPQEYGYVPNRAEPRAKQADYETVEVIPVSDPNSSTLAQRVVQMQAVHQLSTTAPQIYNLAELHRQMIETMGVKNAEKLVPVDDDAEPLDPVSENMNVLMGKPMKAFIYQDHQAHLAAHQAFMQDPMIMQTIGQNPMAQQIMAALQAHIAEHLAYNYRQQLQDRLGAPLPTPNEALPAEIEVQLSRLVADAGKQLTQMHQQQAAQAEAQKQAQDPVFQQKEKELAIKQAEVNRKAEKDRMDKDTDDKEVAIEAMKVKQASADKQADRAAKGEETTKKLQTDVMKEVLKDAIDKNKPDSGGNSKNLMAETLFSALRKEMDKEIEPLANFTINGGAKEYAEYVGLCEKIAGLELAKTIVDDLERRQLNDE